MSDRSQENLELISNLDNIGSEIESGQINNVGWSIGNYCDAKCKHCYSAKIRNGKMDLTKEDINIIVDKLVELGVDTINLGGNEPIYTNGPDWRRGLLPYIIEKLNDNKIVTGITTYGKTANVLHQYYPDVFELVNDWDVSFDSPHMMEHDANRGANVYKEAVKASKILAREKKPHSMVMCAMNMQVVNSGIDENKMKRNESVLKSLGLDEKFMGSDAFYKAQLGLLRISNFDEKHLNNLTELAKILDSEIRINVLKPTDFYHDKMVLGVKQEYEGFHLLIKNSDHIVTMGESRYSGMMGLGGYGCPCGNTSMRIHSKTPEGTVPVSPCVYMHEFKVEDLLKDHILGEEGIVNRPEFRVVRKRLEEIPNYCKDTGCEIKDVCRGGCSALAYFTEGKYIPNYFAENGDIKPIIQTRRSKPFVTKRTSSGLEFFYSQAGKSELERLWKPDPYSPKLAKVFGISLQDLPKRTVGHDGVRVHENYLCTFIMKPK